MKLPDEVKKGLFVPVHSNETHEIFNIKLGRSILLKNKLTLFVMNIPESIDPFKNPKYEAYLMLDFIMGISETYQELLYLTFILGGLNGGIETALDGK